MKELGVVGGGGGGVMYRIGNYYIAKEYIYILSNGILLLMILNVNIRGFPKLACIRHHSYPISFFYTPLLKCEFISYIKKLVKENYGPKCDSHFSGIISKVHILNPAAC